jgi:hypothetical protein
MGFLDAFKAMLWSRLRREPALAGLPQAGPAQIYPLDPYPDPSVRKRKVSLTHWKDFA